MKQIETNKTEKNGILEQRKIRVETEQEEEKIRQLKKQAKWTAREKVPRERWEYNE